MENAFLKDFIRMRQSLGTSEVKKDVKKGVDAMPSKQGPTHTSLATIIENKPPAKVVLKYFKKKYGDASSSDSD
jgi:hypothetical protein